MPSPPGAPSPCSAEAPWEERLARVALNALGEPGDPRLERLVSTMGPVELHRRLLDDVDLAGLRSEASARLAGLEPERILEQAMRLGIRFVVPGDSEWPEALGDLSHVEPLNRLSGAPLGVWAKGPLALAEATGRSVAVVGSRSATTYGGSVAGEISAHVAQAGVAVVSGAAFGIDQAAHRGALAGGGSTVAVLACGVDRAYPTAHRSLLEHIAAHGLVVSELRPGCAPTRVRFLSRNRLIAALTQGTVVVEAAVRSGALNTANWAARLNRVLMGVPGPVTSAPSEGVHELVRSGSALLVTRGEHVLEAVSTSGEHVWVPPRAEPNARDRLGDDQVRVLEAVPAFQAAPVGAIARTAGRAVSATAELLAGLEREGWVERVEGRWRQAAPTRTERHRD